MTGLLKCQKITQKNIYIYIPLPIHEIKYIIHQRKISRNI